MSEKRSLKEIMAEQQVESQHEAIEKTARKKEEKDRISCAALRKIKIYTQPEELNFLQKFTYLGLDRIICSLLVPENKNKTIEYLHGERTGVPKQDIFDVVKMPCLRIGIYYMYSYSEMLCWIEDGLYKILEFDSISCPSGGCDGQSIHQLVGISPDDVLGLLRYKKLYPTDKTKIIELFTSLCG